MNRMNQLSRGIVHGIGDGATTGALCALKTQIYVNTTYLFDRFTKIRKSVNQCDRVFACCAAFGLFFHFGQPSLRTKLLALQPISRGEPVFSIRQKYLSKQGIIPHIFQENTPIVGKNYRIISVKKGKPLREPQLAGRPSSSFPACAASLSALC